MTHQLLALLLFALQPAFSNQDFSIEHQKPRLVEQPPSATEIINSYTPVVSFSCDSTVLNVGSSDEFNVGDKVLIIQMQGAIVDTTNTANFGNIIDPGTAGNNEFNRVYAITGNEIKLEFRLNNSYDVTGKVQLIRVPEFTELTTSGLTCKPWNGNTGGVLVFDVADVLTLNGDIDVSGLGFRGGAYEDANNISSHETQYYYINEPRKGAKKGEGISIIADDRSFGRGNVANAGGGGNAHNAGGGGGANYSSGGRGGYEYYNTPGAPNFMTFGIEGKGLHSVIYQGNLTGRYFMGGGGGAGQANDNKGSKGGNGGGIIVINAGSIEGNQFYIKSNGENITGPGGNTANDGQGGGGGGGTIVLNCENTSGLSLEARGGRGGDCLFYVSSQIIGAGGGGAGGLVVSKPLGQNVSIILEGGIHGLANQGLSNGAENGIKGQLFEVSEPLIIEGVTPSPLSKEFELALSNPSCSNPSSGQIVVLNVPGALFSLNAGPMQMDSVFNGLAAGIYNLSVFFDSIGCQKDTTIELVELSIPLQTLDSLSLCPNDTIVIGSQVITLPGIYTDTIMASVGCDTIATYVVIRTDPPTMEEEYGICPGDSIQINGLWYDQADTSFVYNIPAVDGCDTVVNVNLQYLPLPEITKAIAFCPGDTVFVAGNAYTQPDTVFDVILPASSGCDTLATYVLTHLAQPSVTRTIEFCPGDTVVLEGVAYTQPDTVQDIVLPATTGCDTLATYILSYLSPQQPTAIGLQCPSDIAVTVPAGGGGAVITFPDPVASSDCPCPGLELQQTSGLASGELFPGGVTDVCFFAKDSCGNQSECCFSVTVNEEDACDVKTIGCMRYELLSITRDNEGDKTYRIRVTNYCADEMVHVAIQLPNGIIADQPDNGTFYTAPSGIPYLVRNPHHSPQHCIRFKTAGTAGIKNGESDVFKYTIPEQAQPDYIHVTARIQPAVYYSAHLNTFFCPITYEPEPWSKPPNKQNTIVPMANDQEPFVKVYPNPGSGTFNVTLDRWAGEKVDVKVYTIEGKLLHSTTWTSGASTYTLDLPPNAAAGSYLLNLLFDDGRQEHIRLTKTAR
jgi:hypothetical protein